jgi:hypothetical protein
MLSSGLSYNLFFWIEFALGCVLFLVTLAFFEETMYLEKRQPPSPSSERPIDTDVIKDEPQATSECRESRLEESATVPPRKTYLEQCKIFGKTDPNSPVFLMMVKPHSAQECHRLSTDGIHPDPILYLPDRTPGVLGLLYLW